MTGADTAAALYALGGAAAGTAATAGAAVPAGTIISAAEAAALGLTAAQASSAAAAGLSAAEVAAGMSAAAPAAAAGETTAGLLAAQGGAEFAPAAAHGQAGLLGQQTAEFGAEGAQLTNAAADPAMAQGIQQPWLQRAQGWLGEKPLGNGPTRGKMITRGGKAMMPQEQQAAPPAQRGQGQFHPGAQSSPYANMQMPGGGQFLSMADFLRRYQG